uniref:ENDD1 protein n=1 Tax=Malurus cyaneus samueli TaxID=2593467 RepID=A0A8C5XAA4_9PASS
MLWLLLLQVSASCLWLGHSEVVTSFEKCPQFFYEETPPNEALTPQNAAWICQRYNNQYHFATLYDKSMRIPVYSAYIYQPGPLPSNESWFVEPQLITLPNNMKTEDFLEHNYTIGPQQIGQNQAISEDYTNLNELVPGHLCPSGHQNTDDSKSATFTLTNAVPMNRTLSNNAWEFYENQMMAEKMESCTTTYVIKGAVPGNSSIANGRVNVPSHIWLAACCQTSTTTKAWAFIAEENHVQLLTLKELEAELSQLYGRGNVSLFYRDCAC